MHDSQQVAVSYLYLKISRMILSWSVLFLLSIADVTQVQWDNFLQSLDDELQLSVKILDTDHQSKYIFHQISLSWMPEPESEFD